jgi:hypothetical protein
VPLEKLPPTFEREVGVVTTDLVRILDAYNRLLSSYLDATVRSQVPPGLSRDLAVFRPSDGSWWILRSSDGTLAGRVWGLPADKPVVGSPR